MSFYLAPALLKAGVLPFDAPLGHEPLGHELEAEWLEAEWLRAFRSPQTRLPAPALPGRGSAADGGQGPLSNIITE